jgi:uncharacterized protein (TIGR03067 family)
MSRNTLIVFAGSLFIAAALASAQESGLKQELARLQGTWNFAEMEVDGRALQPATFRGSRIVIDENRFTTITAGVTYKGTFSVDITKSPKTIDMTFTEGPEKGNTALGIYELEKDRWKICLTTGALERPRAFATKEGAGLALETLTRNGGNAANAAAQKEMERLAGNWAMVSGSIGGFPMPAEMVKTGRRVAKGNETTVMIGGQLFLKATFTVDPSKTPKSIDYTLTAGANQGKVLLGIYEFDGDTVRFCFGSPGAERPDSFETKSRDGRTSSVWKRE